MCVCMCACAYACACACVCFVFVYMRAHTQVIPSTGWTALMCAVDEGNYACAELLLRKRASVSKTTKSGINAMTLAIRCQKSPKNGSQSIFKLLQHYNALLPDIEKVILNAPKMQGIVRGFLVCD